MAWTAVEAGEYQYDFTFEACGDDLDAGEFQVLAIFGLSTAEDPSVPRLEDTFAVGWDDGGTDKLYRTILKIQTPTNPTSSAAAKISKLSFKIKTGTGGTGQGHADVEIFAHPIALLGSLVDMDDASWTLYDTGQSWGTLGADYDDSTDYGFGGNGKLGSQTMTTADTFYTIRMDAFADQLEWDTEYAFLLKSSEPEGDTITSDKWASNLSVDNSDSDVFIVVKDAVPEAPVITATAKAGGTDALIAVSHGNESDLLDFNTSWTSDGSAPVYNGAKINTVADAGLKELDTSKAIHFAANILATENTRYRVGLFARDNSFTYAGDNASTQGTLSNILDLARPGITSTSWSGGSNTGDSGTMTVTAATGGAWSSYGAGALKYLYVNWDGPSSGATVDDAGVSKIEITTTGATSIARSHIYSTAGAKNVWVALEDTLGFRSDFDMVTGGDIPNPSARNAIPVALASKKTHLYCKYGLIDSANTLNGIKSSTGISDEEIYHYLWQHGNTAAIMTAFSTDNDNQYFETQSKKVKVKCNWGSNSSADRQMDGTTLTVYGIASFKDASGTETATSDLIADGFTSDDGYYRYVSSEISTASTENTYGTASTNYFKMIDKIVVTVKDAQDVAANAARYQVATDTGDAEMVNNRICCTPSSYLWGNYATATTSSFTDNTCDYNNDPTITHDANAFIIAGLSVSGTGIPAGAYIASITDSTHFELSASTTGGSVTNGTLTFSPTTNKDSNYIVQGNSEFIEDGFAVGDKIYVTFSSNTGFDGVYTISALTATRITFEETLAGSGLTAETHVIHTDTRANAAIPYSAYHATTQTTTTFTLGVSQSRIAASPQTTTLTIRHRVPHELDLDSLIDSGNIALVDATISRAGGLTGRMPVGDRAYPIGISRTSAGLPTITATFKALDQTGLRTLWNLLEGTRYDWCLLESDRIDSPATPQRTFVLKLQDGSLKRDAASGKHYTASLKFVAIGEEV